MEPMAWYWWVALQVLQGIMGLEPASSDVFLKAILGSSEKIWKMAIGVQPVIKYFNQFFLKPDNALLSRYKSKLATTK